MSQITRPIEVEYQRRIRSMTPKDRVARSTAMLKWTREALARTVVREQGAMSDERLRWEVALRLYQGDAKARAKIEQVLRHVSG